METFGHSVPAKDLEILAQLAEEVDARRVLEIGSFVGHSALNWLNCKSPPKVFCVDTWRGIERLEGRHSPVEFLKAFLGNCHEHLGEAIVPLWGPSKAWAAAWPMGVQFDIVFVDADHRHESVVQDALSWWPHLRDGGIMAFHDYGVYNGVTKAVRETLFGPQGRIRPKATVLIGTHPTGTYSRRGALPDFIKTNVAYTVK